MTIHSEFIATEKTKNGLALKVATALLITFAVALVLVHIESYLVGQHALDLLNAEHHFAEIL